MTPEIEEKISEEIDIAYFKFQRNAEKLAQEKMVRLDEIEGQPNEVNDTLSCIMDFMFEQKKLCNNLMIDLKSIQEKYEKELSEG